MQHKLYTDQSTLPTLYPGRLNNHYAIMIQKAYKEGTEFLLNDITTRLRQLETRNSELVQSLHFTQNEMNTLKKENNQMREQISQMKREQNSHNEVTDKVNHLNERINYQEDYSRRLNLRFDGVSEQRNETWEATQEKIQQCSEISSIWGQWNSSWHIVWELSLLRGQPVLVP